MDFIEDAETSSSVRSSDSLIQVVHGTPDAVADVVHRCRAGDVPARKAERRHGLREPRSPTRSRASRDGRACSAPRSAASGAVSATSRARRTPTAIQQANDTWSSDAGAIAMMDKAGEFFQPAGLHHLSAPPGLGTGAGRRGVTALRPSRGRPVEVAVPGSPAVDGPPTTEGWHEGGRRPRPARHAPRTIGAMTARCSGGLRRRRDETDGAGRARGAGRAGDRGRRPGARGRRPGDLRAGRPGARAGAAGRAWRPRSRPC